MDHAQPLPRVFPWRTATLVAGALAMLELVALIVGGTLLFAHPVRHPAEAAAKRHTAPAVRAVAHVRPVPMAKSQPLRPRSRVAVLVLNGNGVQGAASREAAHLQGLGYRIGGAENAARHDYARSMVMYAPGWRNEARRLSRDAGIRMVAPVDGMRRSALRASPLVLLLGS